VITLSNKNNQMNL